MELMDWTDEILAERFDRIDERFDRVDEKFGEVNRRIDEVKEELSEIRQGVWSMQRTTVIANFAVIGGLIGVIASILATGG